MSRTVEQDDQQGEKIRASLHRLFPKAEMHRILEEVAAQRMDCAEFRRFVWHKMAKAATELVADRKWELVDADLRHKATHLAVIYAMHCVYERAALGLPNLCCLEDEGDFWTWGSKAG